MKGDAVTDYFRNRKANSLANKRTRLLLHRCSYDQIDGGS